MCPPVGVPRVVPQVVSHSLPKLVPPRWVSVGWSPWVVLKGWSCRGRPSGRVNMGGPAGGVPQVGSPNCSPPRWSTGWVIRRGSLWGIPIGWSSRWVPQEMPQVVQHGVSVRGNFQGFPEWRSFMGLPRIGIPKEGHSANPTGGSHWWGPKMPCSSGGFLRWCPPWESAPGFRRRVPRVVPHVQSPKGGRPRRVPHGVFTRGDPTGVVLQVGQRGGNLGRSPGDPQGEPICGTPVGSRRSVYNVGHQVKFPRGGTPWGSLKRYPAREYPTGCPTRGAQHGVSKVGVS